MTSDDFLFLGIRGLGGAARSTGIDAIADHLHALNLNCVVINQEGAVENGKGIVRQSAKKQIVLFGYSMGATDAIDLARELIAGGYQVPLLLTMDPHLHREQVSGVRRHVNIWQPHPMFGFKPFFAVTPVPEANGQLENIVAENVASHGDLDDTEWVQDRIEREIEELLTAPTSALPALPTEPLLPPWMVEVNKHIGLHEQKDNQALSEYLLSDGTTLGDPAENPWCGDLVETVIANSLPDETIPANPYWARNWSRFGVECEPRLYCVLVFKRGDGGHVGFMVGETKSHYIVRGGNQSNRITDSEYKKSDLLAARWPKTSNEHVIQRPSSMPAEPAEIAAFHKAFFDAVRDPLFQGRLTQSQVDGMKMTIAEWFKSSHQDERWLSYMLATAWLETDRTMQAITEYGDRAYFVRMYDKSGNRPDVAKRLGNVHVGDGAKFHGRGKPMLTGRANYAKADRYVGKALGISFESTPSLVLKGNHSDLIMISGMVSGWYTGKKLSDYFHDDLEDPINARRIVNGLDKAEEIADAYEAFQTAVSAGYDAHKRVGRPAPTEAGLPEVIVSGSNRLPDLQALTGQALIALASASLAELRRRENMTSVSRPTVLVDLSKTNSPETGDFKMPPINGNKTYIVMFMVAAIAIVEGVIGIDIPGAEMQDNWIEYVLGAAGVGSIRHAIAKVIGGLIG